MVADAISERGEAVVLGHVAAGGWAQRGAPRGHRAPLASEQTGVRAGWGGVVPIGSPCRVGDRFISVVLHRESVRKMDLLVRGW